MVGDNWNCTIDNEITAIVLAGGKSSRMGRDKALLTIEGETLLARICSVAKKVATQILVVSPWIEQYRSILPSEYRLIKEELVLNDRSNAPIIGFAEGLKFVETEWVLLLACDLPYLSSTQVKQWSLSLATVLPTEIALLPPNSKGWEVLCGFYRREVQSSLQAYLQNGGKSLQKWLAQNSVRELEVSDRTCLFNCNTPVDWQKVIASEQ